MPWPSRRALHNFTHLRDYVLVPFYALWRLADIEVCLEVGIHTHLARYSVIVLEPVSFTLCTLAYLPRDLIRPLPLSNIMLVYDTHSAILKQG